MLIQLINQEAAHIISYWILINIRGLQKIKSKPNSSMEFLLHEYGTQMNYEPRNKLKLLRVHSIIKEMQLIAKRYGIHLWN